MGAVSGSAEKDRRRVANECFRVLHIARQTRLDVDDFKLSILLKVLGKKRKHTKNELAIQNSSYTHGYVYRARTKTDSG